MKCDIYLIFRSLIVSTLCLDFVLCANPVISKYPLEVYQMFRNRMRPTTLGTWSSWSQWSSCTRSCGGGVAMQTRECLEREDVKNQTRNRRRVRKDIINMTPALTNSVDKNVTVQCVGVYKRFHICNEKPCSAGAKDFRQIQCERFNGKKFMGHIYRWEPFISAPHACELNCRAIGEKFYATFNKTVIDGTPCGVDERERWVCVTGLCKHVGCDGVVGSNMRLDSCGVCGGTNSTCSPFSGIYTKPHLPEGYNMIIQIPRGACNITIIEMKPSVNGLAIRRSIDHKYILNGNWDIGPSGEYEGAGTKFIFQQQDDLLGDMVTATGPLHEPVDLMILYQKPNPGIKYEFSLPPGSDMPSTAVIAPPLLQPGSRPLPNSDVIVKDAPVQDRPEPRRSDNPGFPNGLDPRSHTLHNPHSLTPVADEAVKPPPRRGKKRRFTWKIIGYTDCSRPCAGGVKTSVIACVREQNQATVQERRCGHQPRPQIHTITCNTKACPAEWVPGDWSECSVTCGEGTQTRTVMCHQVVSSTYSMIVKDGACFVTPPHNTQKCVKPSCFSEYGTKITSAHWKTGEWSQCSVSCGHGIRSRAIKCMSENGIIERHDCPHDHKPHHEESCDLGPCNVSTFHTPSPWLATHWSKHCSEDCGTGIQTRKVQCSKDTCDASLKPEETRPCSSEKQCSGKWFVGPWGQCTPQCGQGKQYRDVVCVAYIRGQHRVAFDMNCPIAHKPEIERFCESVPCGDEWYFSEWSPCSKDCGGGILRREVECLDEKKNPSSRCSEEDRPASKKPCNTHECSTGFNSETSRHHSKVDDDPSSNGAGDQAVPDENGHKGGGTCVDSFPNCQLVTQARMCRFKYYRSFCCHSCHRKHKDTDTINSV